MAINLYGWLLGYGAVQQLRIREKNLISPPDYYYVTIKSIGVAECMKIRYPGKALKVGRWID